MSLIEDVRDVLRPLSEPWKEMLREHGLDLTEAVLADTALLAQALRKKLRVQRSIRGFEDFAIDRPPAITPGKPAESLLYHALASPAVFTTPEGQPQLSSNEYPSLHDLDTLENYIYSLNKDSLHLDGAFIAVLAYQYRTGARSAHGQHADMTYSRTGVARVGTRAPHYHGFRRSFWPIPEAEEEAQEMAVMPARYAAFLARSLRPVGAGAVQGGHRGVNDDPYVFPFHKLFDGPECIQGRNLRVQFSEYHLNEKLRRVHADALQGDGGMPLPAGFDKNAYPYIRDSEGPEPVVRLESVGSSCLVVPLHQTTLVRTARQLNTDTGREEIVHFRVPARTSFRNRDTRFITSLEIPSFSDAEFDQGFRKAPEYVNIRHRLDPNDPAQAPEDINGLDPALFDKLMQEGDYRAPHFVDDSADGCVMATVSGLQASENDRPAYSLVTAPDFFPLADQMDLFEFQSQIGKFTPLSLGRIPVNPTLKLPAPLAGLAFPSRERTVTAVVGDLPIRQRNPEPRQINVMTSFLPDAASDVYQPGWDVAVSRDDKSVFRTSFGLGSPFPEDAKLCAALSSFWPAVAPDASRTFGNVGNFMNFMPMLDTELGFHPQHPLVTSGQEKASTGWDGETGPFFEDATGSVNFADIARSDYVANALAGGITVAKTANVQSEELLARAIALVRCQRLFSQELVQPGCLVTAEQVADWATRPDRGHTRLRGDGYLYVFAALGEDLERPDIRRRRRRVQQRFICQIGTNGMAIDFGNGFRFEEGA